MSAVFLVWLKAERKRKARIQRQFTSSKPSGIV